MLNGTMSGAVAVLKADKQESGGNDGDEDKESL